MENSPRRPRILALSDGRAGHVHQTEGVLNHLPDADHEMIRVEYPSKGADNALRAKMLMRRGFVTPIGARAMLSTALTPDSFTELANVSPPDIVFSTGSSLAAPNLLLSKMFGAKSVVCTRPSPLGIKPFDLALLPRHQWIDDAPNTARLLGVPTHITPELVAERRAELDATGQTFGPTIGILFGGDDRRYRWTVDLAQRTIEALVGVAGQTGTQIAIATSRRTPPEVEAFLKSRLSESPRCIYSAFVSDPTPKDKPVLTIFALSAWVAVTVDSFSMVCEAASSGRPVGLIQIPSRRADRHASTFDAISDAAGMTQMRLDTLYESASAFTRSPRAARPLRDAETAANAVRVLLGLGAPIP